MSKVTHVKKFDSWAKRTPQEYHAEFAFPRGAKCSGCGGRPEIRAIVMVPLDEAEKRGMIPEGASKVPHAFTEIVPALVPIDEGGSKKWYLRVSKAYSCRQCQKDFEMALAKGPSWAIVEINRGPDPTNRVRAV